MNAPHTPTLTLNMTDNPLTFTLERDINGNLEWRLHWDPLFLADPGVVRRQLLQLQLTSMTWFYQTYGVIGPDGHAVDFATDAGQQLLTTLADARNNSQEAIDRYRQLIAKADE